MPPGSFQSFVWKHYSFFVSNGTTDWVIESKYSKSKDHNQNRIESKVYELLHPASFWLVKANFQPIRRTAQIWLVTHYQHGISAFIPADLPIPRPCKSGVFERKLPKTSRLGPQTWSSPISVSRVRTHLENPWKPLNFRSPISRPWKYLNFIFGPWRSLSFYWTRSKMFCTICKPKTKMLTQTFFLVLR